MKSQFQEIPCSECGWDHLKLIFEGTTYNLYDCLLCNHKELIYNDRGKEISNISTEE